MMVAWGETSEEEDSQEEEAAVALTAGSESESESEILSQLKEKVRCASKLKLKKLLFTLFDDFEEVNTENCVLKDVYSELKKDIRLLEKNNREIERLNEILISEKLEIEEKNLALCQNLTNLRTSLNIRESGKRNCIFPIDFFIFKTGK